MNPSERESSYNDDSSTILLLQDENPPEEVDAPERSMNRKQLSFYISQFTATLIELNISYNSLGQWQTPLLCTLFEHLMDSPCAVLIWRSIISQPKVILKLKNLTQSNYLNL